MFIYVTDTQILGQIWLFVDLHGLFVLHGFNMLHSWYIRDNFTLKTTTFIYFFLADLQMTNVHPCNVCKLYMGLWDTVLGNSSKISI